MEEHTRSKVLRLKDLLTAKPPKVSFEFFPPKTEEMESILWQSIQELAPLSPHFVSVTYGAGGTTRERTHATLKRILTETTLRPAAHFTCVGSSKDEIREILEEYWAMGVRHIVALRGDPPEGANGYKPHPGGYAYASDLVEGIRTIADFEISVAAYPETHPEAVSATSDLDYLKRKVDAGATRAITQFFFDTEQYLRFIEKANKIGINVPIVPGILPVTNFSRAVDFAGKCGANVPKWFAHMFDGLDDQPATRNLVAAIVAAEQCQQLQAEGVEEFHFYTLNRAGLTRAICHILGIRPGQS
ncbi:MAG: metF [Rickettsiales bacterium]|jgi:methylenetetrahydrofolate reductase (NADPH)|nr:metF [Rickettsiales bacterium]